MGFDHISISVVAAIVVVSLALKGLKMLAWLAFVVGATSAAVLYAIKSGYITI